MVGWNPRRKSRVGSTNEELIPLDVESFLALEEQGTTPIVPAVFCDTGAYNRIGLGVYNALMDAMAENEAFIAQRGLPQHLNLVAVFFHEVQRMLTSYYFKRYELDLLASEYGIDVSDWPSGRPPRSPLIGYEFVIDPVSPKNSQDLLPSKRNLITRQKALELINHLGSLIPRKHKSNLKTLIVTPSLASHCQQLASTLNAIVDGRDSWEVCTLRPEQSQIVLPLFEAQQDILNSHLAGLVGRLGMALPEGLSRLLNLWILGNTANDYSGKWSPSILLTGTQAHLGSRIAAVRAKSEGVPVVSVFHGEAYGNLDEPVFGYAEDAFSDAVIGYGQDGGALAVTGEFTKPLFDDPVSYVPSAPNVIRHIYSEEAIPTLMELSSPTFMYVPTSFSGVTLRYGPFRDMHDIAYLEWQRGLMASFCKMFPGKVIWKPHPKEKLGIEITLPQVTTVSGIRFEEVLETADVFIFDYISTSFNIAAATTKPIIYFDIGLRNPSPKALEAIRERCIYVQSDPREPQVGFRQALESGNKQCVNRYTTRFSLPPDRRPRHEVIAETILRLA